MVGAVVLVFAVPVLQARCVPERPERGSIVTCSARLRPQGPVTLIEKRALAGGHAEVERESAELADGAIDWSGPAVVDTTVVFRVKPKGASRELTAAARYAVQPRRWPASLGLESLPWEYGPDDLFGGYPPRLAPGSTLEDPTPGQGALAVTRIDLDNAPWLLATEGPNARWYYVSEPLRAPARYRVYLSRALKSDDPFFVAQHAETVPQTLGAGHALTMERSQADTHCDEAAMSKLRFDILRHEGASDAPYPNHRSEYQRALSQELTLQAELEALTGHLDDFTPPAPSFAEAISARIRAWLEAARARQQWLETAEGRVVFRCTLRYPQPAGAR